MKTLMVVLALLGSIAVAAPAMAAWQATTVVINSSTTLPVGTGMVAASGDQFVIIARGAGQVFLLDPVDNSWFDPSGLIRMRRGGQVFTDMPYGSLFAHFSIYATGGFYVGDGGSFTAQPIDVGHELLLNLNMSASDRAMMSGSFVISVLRIGATTVNAPEIPAPEVLLHAQPNPLSSSATIQLPSDENGPFEARIYDVTGRIVRTIPQAEIGAAREVQWDSRDDGGLEVAAGTYYCQVSGKSGSRSCKLTVVR